MIGRRPRCAQCRRPLVGSAWALVRTRPAALVRQDGTVVEFSEEIVTTFCDEHEPLVA